MFSQEEMDEIAQFNSLTFDSIIISFGKQTDMQVASLKFYLSRPYTIEGLIYWLENRNIEYRMSFSYNYKMSIKRNIKMLKFFFKMKIRLYRRKKYDMY